MSASGWGSSWGDEKKAKANNTEQDNNANDQEHGNRRLIKPCSSKTTRVTLRKTKAAETPRPPWNTGTSPSPATTKAGSATAKRTMPRRLPVRPKLPTQEEFFNPCPTEDYPTATSAVELPARCQTPEPAKSMIPAKDPETGLTWKYDRLNAYLEHPAQSKLSGNHEVVKEPPSDADATPTRGADMTKELRQDSQMFSGHIEVDSFLDSELMTSPRLKLPLSSPALGMSAKRDPAIIACGPTILRPKVNVSPETPKDIPEKHEKEDKLDLFRKTLGQLKGDQMAFVKLLELLKNLESDENHVKHKESSKKEPNQSCTVSKPATRNSLNPRAPVFWQSSFQKSIDASQPDRQSLSIRRKGSSYLENNKDEALTEKEYTKTWNSMPRGCCSGHCVRPPAIARQEPIWINTSQAPAATVNPKDGDFQEFCRANNFIPLVPVNPIPIIPVTLVDPIHSIQSSYVPLRPDSIPMDYTRSFKSVESDLLTAQLPLVQLTENVLGALSGHISAQSYQPIAIQDMSSLLEETSEPLEDSYREAKALDPVWGIQILENFLKKYPMTGQREPKASISDQIENNKPAAKEQQSQRPEDEGKVAQVNAYTHAAELQQKLEMLLLKQRENGIPRIPTHKIKATEIQQKLEIMLYKMKEQKALEGFSKRKRALKHSVLEIEDIVKLR
jgi:hypothetical protein